MRTWTPRVSVRNTSLPQWCIEDGASSRRLLREVPEEERVAFRGNDDSRDVSPHPSRSRNSFLYRACEDTSNVALRLLRDRPSDPEFGIPKSSNEASVRVLPGHPCLFARELEDRGCGMNGRPELVLVRQDSYILSGLRFQATIRVAFCDVCHEMIDDPTWNQRRHRHCRFGLERDTGR